MTTSFPVATVHGGPEERTDFDRLMKGPNAYRTISEVADELHVPQHVLRFWETRFPEVKPLKRGGGRRYYSPADIEILRRITDLLYVQGYTIKGVQRVLKEQMGALTTPTASAMPVVDPAPLPPVSVPVVEVGRTSFEIPAFQPSEPDHVHSGPRDVEGALTDAGISSEATADEFRDSGHETQGSHAGPAVETPGDEDLDRADQHPDQSEGSCDGDHTPQDGGEISPGPVETILDPGEETSASAMVSPAEDTPAEQTPQPVHPAGLSGVDEALVTILQDELVALRTEQGRWKQERRALRLALEDVLGELDSLRAMLPQA